MGWPVHIIVVSNRSGLRRLKMCLTEISGDPVCGLPTRSGDDGRKRLLREVLWYWWLGLKRDSVAEKLGDLRWV